MGSTLVGNLPSIGREGTVTGDETDVTTDLVDSIVTLLTVTTFNNRTPQELRADFDVLAFPRAANLSMSASSRRRHAANKPADRSWRC